MSRKVRVAAFTDLCPDKPRTVETNLDWTCGILDRLAFEKPDIVCLTETFDTRETGLSHPEMAQGLEDLTVTRVREKAREHGFYVVCAYIEKREHGIFNTARVIDRQGAVAGCYDKIHPTNNEIDDAVLPGQTKPPVIDTDFGRIGCQICFDANWPEGWRQLKEAGAELIFFPSAFSAGRILQSIATLFHVPIVAACCPQCCRVIDRDGLVLNRQGVYQQWVLATLDLDSPLFHLDYQADKLEAVRKAYGPDITVRTYEEEGWWRIYSHREDLSVSSIVSEYGLETLEEYIGRSTRYQDEHRPS